MKLLQNIIKYPDTIIKLLQNIINYSDAIHVLYGRHKIKYSSQLFFPTLLPLLPLPIIVSKPSLSIYIIYHIYL